MRRVVARQALVLAAWVCLAGGCVLNSDDACGPNMAFVAETQSCTCVPHAVAVEDGCEMCGADEVASGGTCKPAAVCAVEDACPDAQ